MNELQILTAWALLQCLTPAAITAVIAFIFFYNKMKPWGWAFTTASVLSVLYYLPNILNILVAFDFLYKTQQAFGIQ